MGCFYGGLYFWDLNCCKYIYIYNYVNIILLFGRNIPLSKLLFLKHATYIHMSYSPISVGFTGPLCMENINDCEPKRCHHGDCIDRIAAFFCECHPGYMGPICSEQIRECQSDPCQNGGRCVDLVNMYQCNCLQGTSGESKIWYRATGCILHKFIMMKYHFIYFNYMTSNILRTKFVCNKQELFYFFMTT